MQEKENLSRTRQNGNGSTHPNPEPQSNGTPQELNPDQELVYRLKNAIETRGRYSYRLQDMSAGFAAGQKISNTEARRIIEDRFTSQIGMSPQEFLDRHYDLRRQHGKESNQSRQNDKEQDRGR